MWRYQPTRQLYTSHSILDRHPEGHWHRLLVLALDQEEDLEEHEAHPCQGEAGGRLKKEVDAGLQGHWPQQEPAAVQTTCSCTQSVWSQPYPGTWQARGGRASVNKPEVLLHLLHLHLHPVHLPAALQPGHRGAVFFRGLASPRVGACLSAECSSSDGVSRQGGCSRFSPGPRLKPPRWQQQQLQQRHFARPWGQGPPPPPPSSPPPSPSPSPPSPPRGKAVV